MKNQSDKLLTIVQSDEQDYGSQLITVCNQECKDYGTHAYYHGNELSIYDIKTLFQEIQKGKPNRVLSFSGVSFSKQALLELVRKLRECKNLLVLRFENIKSKLDIFLLATAFEVNPRIKILNFKDTPIDERAAKYLAKVIKYKISTFIVIIDPSCRLTKQNIRYIINKEHKPNTQYYLLHKIPVLTAVAIARWHKRRKMDLPLVVKKTKPSCFKILPQTMPALPALPNLPTPDLQNIDLQASCLTPAHKAITYAFNRFKTLGLTSNVAITSLAVTTVALTANSLIFK